MGGKHNLSNRTKNNVRPSKSGRSAAMLNSSVPQFGGFSNSKESTGLSFSFGSNEEFDPSIKESFQLAMKKISKKDSTTKLKGLQEFSELVKNAESETVKAVLPVWPRFYTALVADLDNRVREATQNAHYEIVIKSRRNIAPYLKQIMAPWFVSQYDNYPPAATAAIKAFKDVFSENKFQEALIFCQDEILSYIYETLSTQMDQKISANAVLPEEAEAKYERNVISCIYGYSLFLQKVPIENISKSVDCNLKIVSNSSFLKLATSKICLVRSAWFQLLSVILQKSVFLIKDKESQILKIILAYLDDDQPLVLPHVWECLLLVTSVIPNWWKYINVENLLIPKLIKVLRKAGEGCATIIYPNLLPLLSNLPLTDKENVVQFYDTFFEALLSGLKLKSVQSSKSESTAIAAAFFECLQYSLLEKSSDIQLCQTMIKNHLILTLEWCITEDSACYRELFSQTSLFVQSLSRSSKLEHTEAMLLYVFENIQHKFSVLLQQNSSSIDSIILISERQIELLRSLKQIKHKKRGSVKFVVEGDPTSSSKKSNKSIIENDPCHTQVYQLAVKLFQDYVKFISVNSSKQLIDKLYSLVMEFNKNIFFEYLLEDIPKEYEIFSFMDIYNHLFKKWLISESTYCKSIIDLIFILMTYLQDQDKKEILNDLAKISQPTCLAWSVAIALSYPHVENDFIRKWFEDERIGLFFVEIAEKQINNDCPSELELILRMALRENTHGDLLVPKAVLDNIIDKITCALFVDADSISLDSCGCLAAHICNIVYTPTLQLSYGYKLLIALIEFTYKFGNEKENLTSETIFDIRSAWQDALIVLLSNLSKIEIYSLVEKIATTIENQFFLTSFSNKEQVLHLANVIITCINAFCKSTTELAPSLVELVFKRPWTKRSNVILDICKKAEYIKGSMCSPFEEITLNSTLNEKEILECFIWSFIKLYTLCSLNINDEFTEQDVDNQEFENLSYKQFSDQVSDTGNTLLEALYFYVIGESFLLHFKNVKYYKEILYYNAWVGKILQSLFSNLDRDSLTNIFVKLRSKCLSVGWFWCKAAFVLYTRFLEVDSSSDYYEQLTDEILKKNMIGVIHLTQVFKCYDANAVAEESTKSCNQTLTKIISEMENLRQENLSEFFYKDAKTIPWDKAEKVIKIVRVNSDLIQYTSLTRRYWDLLVISLASWVSNCLHSKTLVHKIQYQAMLLSVSELYVNICIRIAKFKEEEVNTDYVNEWEDVVVESIHDDLAQIWFYLAERFSNESENVMLNLPFIQYFGPLTEHMKHELIFKADDDSLKWKKFLKRSCLLLTNSQTSLQLWGYRLLKKLIPGFVKIDTETINTRTHHKKGLIFEEFGEKLNELQSIVNNILMDFRVGENTCRIEPSYDSFTYTCAYLLLWDVMLSLCESASTELRYQYADWLKNGDFLQCFLLNIFKLIPSDILQCTDGKPKPVNDCFLKNPLDTSCYNKFCDGDVIEEMACFLYKTSLVQLPALVRKWWTDLDMKASNLVDKITTLYVSPHLCMEELNGVMQNPNKFKNMKVKVMSGIREIQAVYTIDETQMELTITLPVNYPLGSPTVHCNKQIIGTNQKQWLLQFKKYVLHQNGRIWDGLTLWNNNLDRKFDGVEECYICYAVLHIGTCQLPRLSCQTCKKKFHSTCLYKWFSTSNKSSCPICRNLF